MEKIFGYFRLMRPANIVTAIADILAGIAISGYFMRDEISFGAVLLLIFATIGLYGGGVVMNDVFDAELDAVERPERPIPSGLIAKTEAGILGVTLLVAGIFLAFRVGPYSGSLAFATGIAAVVYDRFSKHNVVLGPLNMGLCRGLNLLLGVSIIPAVVGAYWHFSLVPIVYIAAITMISRGEVHGGRKQTLYAAALLYVIAMASILFVAVKNAEIISTVVAVSLWAFMVFKPLFKAIRNPEGRMIGRSVKAGVLALILMNAAWACAFGHILLALIILLLLPLSLVLAKAFAVT